ncbi:MAG: glycosyltransferase family 39 protein, partial [Betaproteobacteria bacterium]|nr:glycosyltransferase family 39 protein [Betaproteobacteria bacterium]
MLNNWLLANEKIRWPLVLILSAAWLGITAGLRPLMIPDEGRYVGVAWEILQSGHWSTPLLDGMPYFHKPPLFYWLTALSLKIFGVSAWSARFAPILAASCAATGLFIFVRRYVNERTAAISLLVLLTQPFFFAG